MALDDKAVLSEDFVSGHPQLRILSDYLVQTLKSHHLPLTRVDVRKIGPKNSPRIDPKAFEVYRLIVHSDNVLPVMEIDAAIIYNSKGLESCTADAVKDIGYFLDKSDKVSRGHWAINEAIGSVVLVDPNLQSTKIARDLVTRLNAENQVHAIEYKRNMTREAIQNALASQRVVSLDRFGEVYQKNICLDYSPPPLMFRKGYRAEFSQGKGLKWALEIDTDGKVTNVLIMENNNIIDPMLIDKNMILDPRLLAQPLWKTSSPPGFSMYSPEHRRLVDEIKRVVKESGRLLGHNYDDQYLDSLVAPNLAKFLEFTKKPELLPKVNWVYSRPSF